MPDNPEAVLAALFAAIQTVDDDGDAEMALIDRNGATTLEVEERPAIRMWDGDEAPGNLPARPAARKARPSFLAQPCVALYVEGVGAEAGTALNALLARFRRAYLNNEALYAALGSDGTISESSLVRDLAPADKVQANAIIHLDILYQFNPQSP